MEQESRITQPVTGSESLVAEDVNKSASGQGPSHAPTGLPALDSIAREVSALYPDAIEEAFMGLDMPTLRVARNHIVDVCRWLRDAPDLRFDMLSDLTCVDHLDRNPRYDVVYHLFSVRNNARLRLKTGVPEEPAECPTMTDVWVGANWAEREAFDMFGVVFTGHPNLERILTPEDWVYFPLRRDFPLQGPGMVKLYDNVTDIF